MSKLWCDACGDEVTACYPCKFTFHDGREIGFNICPQCMKHGTLVIDLPRRRLIAIVLTTMEAKREWRKRANQ